MRIPHWLLLPVLFGTLSLACGGGGGSASAPAPSFTVAPASLTLPVPPASNVDAANNSYPAPYSGTVSIAVTRSSGFTGAVTLSVAQSSLPTNVKAAFANASDSTGLTVLIPAASTTATLSIQAGYPDPTDTTFTKQLYPAQGSYTIPVTATASGVTGSNGSLALKLIEEPADFALAFASFDTTGAISSIDDFTNLSLTGTSLSETFTAYWASGTYGSPYGPVTLSLSGVPAGLAVSLDTNSATLNDKHTMTLTAQSGLQPGTYSFLLTGSYLGVTHTLPVVVTYSPSPFSLQAPLSPSVSLLQGQALNFPVYLWHNDAFFGTTTPTSGDPSYVGTTSLSVSGVPAGLTVQFSNTNPTGLASVPLQVAAASSLAPGTYTVDLQATRSGAGGVAGVTAQAAPLSLTVYVTSSSTPTLWIQNVEWGQSVVAPNLRLVGGKPALLRVQLLADRPGVAAPAVTATIKSQGGSVLDTVTLRGPATVPTTVNEGDLPTATGPSTSTYTAILPAADLQPNIQVTVSAGTASQTLNPSVVPGYTLNLVAVPIYCQGVAPVLPADSVMTQELTAFWPVQSVNLTHRAPYTTSTVIPAPGSNPLTDTSGDGWTQLLLEMASLRIVDGSTANYYGFFNPSLPAKFTSSIVGLSVQGDGTGIGIDVTTASLFQNDDPSLDQATTIMVHEEGHAFNVNHAPAGGAAYPQLNYPYFGAAIGTWGFDPLTQTAYNPTAYFDVMSYASATHWVSDWDYLDALGFMGQKENPPVSLAAVGGAAATEQWVVSGMVRPDGQIRLAPLLRTTCAQAPPKAGELSLVLESAKGTRAISFAATQVPDLPAGYRHFAFTVPATDELTSAQVRGPGGQSSGRRASTRSLASRTKAVTASAQGGSLVVQETGGLLHLEWDAQAHPYVNVFYEGSSRTTLALNLRGGSADLPLAGLPAGGQFVIHYSDGLNAVVHSAPRQLQP
ncbi:MAG: M66 family metalloprotease [Geothrix sp.]|nr:M66 family metalloprotease [Geothrix sp.]